MMMQRRHQQHSLAGELETENLENERERLDHEDSANNNQKQFLFAADRYNRQGATDRK